MSFRIHTGAGVVDYDYRGEATKHIVLIPDFGDRMLKDSRPQGWRRPLQPWTRGLLYDILPTLPSRMSIHWLKLTIAILTLTTAFEDFAVGVGDRVAQLILQSRPHLHEEDDNKRSWAIGVEWVVFDLFFFTFRQICLVESTEAAHLGTPEATAKHGFQPVEVVENLQKGYLNHVLKRWRKQMTWSTGCNSVAPPS